MVMNTGLRLLMAAKRCEIKDLGHLARTSELVSTTADMIHALQRERGLANLYLGSGGQQAVEQRAQQLAASQAIEGELRHGFDRLSLAAEDMGNGARLFSRMAYVLHGLDALPALRAQVTALAWDPARATAAYSQLVSGLLAVVFEAADSASDPGISRHLVALFHFMQGKEFAGQERAAGAALFASGRAESAGQQRLLHLIDSQERCLQVFADFATDAQSHAWHNVQHSADLAGVERLRRILCTTTAGGPLEAGLSRTWFDHCSARIDAMKTVEDLLVTDLLLLCQQRLDAAQAELATLQQLQDRVPTAATDEPPLAPSFMASAAADHPLAPAGAGGTGYGMQLERSIFELVQEQARRLQTMGQELETARASLNERKLVERAKGLLMAHRSLSEDEAHKAMRQMAMNQNRRLVEVAEAVLAMAEVLPDRNH